MKPERLPFLVALMVGVVAIISALQKDGETVVQALLVLGTMVVPLRPPAPPPPAP